MRSRVSASPGRRRKQPLMFRADQRLLMIDFPRSSEVYGTAAGPAAARAGLAREPVERRACLVGPVGRPSAGSTMTCADARTSAISRWCRRLGAPMIGGGRPSEHGPNLVEPVACLSRIRVAGRFVRADVPVIGCIRFRIETSWRTMVARPARKGRPLRASPGWRRAEV
jgi:hypothetical protein